ncbi:MAG: class I SAM-dependent methyltransferase [Ignavibacteriales bacterium]|nr:class I SAM-dependent methyltransferase [Ignavibacteriales bacterium]
MAEWFKNWFESEEYLEIYKHRDDEDAKLLLKLVLENVPSQDDQTVLDIACGAGRHSLLFAEKGFNVTAFDLSRNLLRVAKNKSLEQKLNIDLFCADIRYLAIKKKFDLIINLFTSFGYFENDEENFALFQEVNFCLKDDGIFVLDYFNSEYLRQNLVHKSIEVFDGKEIIQERYFDMNRVKKNITIRKCNEVKNFTESVRLYNKNELVTAITDAGLKIIKIFGGYRGAEFNINTSQRLVVFASK